MDKVFSRCLSKEFELYIAVSFNVIGIYTIYTHLHLHIAVVRLLNLLYAEHSPRKSTYSNNNKKSSALCICIRFTQSCPYECSLSIQFYAIYFWLAIHKIFINKKFIYIFQTEQMITLFQIQSALVDMAIFCLSVMVLLKCVQTANNITVYMKATIFIAILQYCTLSR